MYASLEDENIIAWILSNDIKTERGVPFDFERFSFMIDPYLDWTPEQGVRKCSQIGWSVMTNIKLFYAANFGIPGTDLAAANVIYTLPSDNDVNQFVPSKTNKLIENNSTIKGYMVSEEGRKKADVDSVQRKQIGNSYVFFKGTKSKTAAIMLTADLNIHDEADRSEKLVIDEYESRLGNSPYKGRWIFSNPSAPNMPADLMYKQSDQKHWFVKCEHCGHWQYLDWFKLSANEMKKSLHCYIDDERGQYICSGCGKILSDEVRRRGRWVKKYSNKSASGYWVSHMMCSWMSAKDLLKTEENKSTAYFYNFVRGIPYVGSDIVVSEEVIYNNIVLGDPGIVPGRVAMGIDNGNWKHYVLMNEKGIFHYGKTRDWDEIKMLIKKYDPWFVVDMNPYPKQSRDLARGNRKGWASFYIDDPKTQELVRWGERDKMNMVYPNRDILFDELVEYIFDGHMNFYGAKPNWIEYAEHWKTMYRAKLIGQQIIQDESQISNEMELKRIRNTWISSTGEDHYCHATLYAFVALMRMVGGGGKIVTTSTMNQLKEMIKSVGGSLKTAPVVKDSKIKPSTNYLDPKLYTKKAKKSFSGGSRSGNV